MNSSKLDIALRYAIRQPHGKRFVRELLTAVDDGRARSFGSVNYSVDTKRSARRTGASILSLNGFGFERSSLPRAKQAVFEGKIALSRGLLGPLPSRAGSCSPRCCPCLEPRRRLALRRAGVDRSPGTVGEFAPTPAAAASPRATGGSTGRGHAGPPAHAGAGQRAPPAARRVRCPVPTRAPSSPSGCRSGRC